MAYHSYNFVTLIYTILKSGLYGIYLFVIQTNVLNAIEISPCKYEKKKI